MKTNKSYTKRIRVTKTGKLLARRPGQNHFNSKNSGEKTLAKHSANPISLSAKAKARFLPGNGN